MPTGKTTRKETSVKLHSTVCVALAIAALTLSQSASAISIIFNYSYDSSGFFTGANASRQTLLNQAAGEFTSRIQDHLTAITSSEIGRAHV